MARSPALFILSAICASLFFVAKIQASVFPIFACAVVFGLCVMFRSYAKNWLFVTVTIVAVAFFCAVFVQGSLEGKELSARTARDARAELVGRVLYVNSWRQSLHNYFKTLPPTLGGYLNAMWTGQRDEKLQKTHVRWGTSHLLAVSGFHVGLVVVLAGALFFFTRGFWRAVLISLFLWGYILMTGAAPSALRAGLMFQVAVCAGLLGRPAVALNSVAVAGVVLLLWSPFLFWDVGWRLSVVAALTITGLAAKLRSSPKLCFFLVSPLVFATTYPIVAATFGSVPLAGVVINFFALPFFAFAFPFMSLAAFTGIFCDITDGSLRLFGMIADAVARVVPFQIGYNSILAALSAVIFVWLVSPGSDRLAYPTPLVKLEQHGQRDIDGKRAAEP